MTPDIWLRRSFRMAKRPRADVKLALFHDEDVEVHVNGVLACRRRGHVTAYVVEPLSADAAAALVDGENVIAVHCRQTAGGQGIDVGLFEGIATEESLNTKPTQVHDLLRDGPLD